MTEYLHELACTDDPCVCRVFYPVMETEQTCDNSGSAERAGDSGAAVNRIDFAIAPSDRLSPGSGGVLRSIEGIVR